MEVWIVIDDCSMVANCNAIGVGVYSTKERAILQARNLILKALQDFGYDLDFSDTTSEYLDEKTMVDLSEGYACIYSDDYDREIITVERRLIGGKVE